MRLNFSPILILYVSALHFLWGVLIIYDPAALHSTKLAIFVPVFGSPGAAAMALLTTSVLGAISCCVRTPMPWVVLLLLPQQAVCILSAIGVLDAIIAGSFADGVQRARAFIAADQINAVLTSVCHALAIVSRAKWGEENR